MITQDKLAFMTTISALQVSPTRLKDFKLAIARRKKPAMSGGKPSTTSVSGNMAFQQLGGKRKANELACSGNSMETAKWRPPGAGPCRCPKNLQSGRTRCCRQPATRAIRGRDEVHDCTGRARRPVSGRWDAQAHRTWIRIHPNRVYHPR